MRTMKIWRIAFAMLAAISLASCSSDDDVVKRLLSTHRRLSNFWTIYMKISGGRPLLDKKALHKNGDFHNYKT